MRYTDPFMKFVMTPPRQEQAKYAMYEPQVSTMRIVSDGHSEGLGQVPVVCGGGGCQESNSWVMPVVVIVVSAMALMTLYAVLNRR